MVVGDGDRGAEVHRVREPLTGGEGGGRRRRGGRRRWWRWRREEGGGSVPREGGDGDGGGGGCGDGVLMSELVCGGDAVVGGGGGGGDSGDGGDGGDGDVWEEAKEGGGGGGSEGADGSAAGTMPDCFPPLAPRSQTMTQQTRQSHPLDRQCRYFHSGQQHQGRPHYHHCYCGEGDRASVVAHWWPWWSCQQYGA